ncbi:YkgJ family cysteine cluster protein [Candidatus Woesearchaeota archaeon]|nr:YkgJ family cysteine cluster protein [Candidatus Woesearchaeota archaeon]
MGPRFICQQCGECCAHIRGGIIKEDETFLREHAYGKMPLIQLIPLEKMSFPLWDWEAKRFREWEQDINVDAKIQPSRAILDLNENKAIIITYFMDYDSCPFLKNKKCLIYNKRRAYVCRLFPFQRTPFLNIGEMTKDFLGTCPAIEDLKIPDGIKEQVKLFNKYFQDGSFLNAVQNDIVTEWINKTIVGLVKNKIIRSAMNYPYGFLLKRIERAEKIDLTDYLISKRLYKKDEMTELISRFDGNIDAKERIKGFLE